MRVAPALALLALLLAQVPWLDCRCEEGSSRSAAVLDHGHCDGHHHTHGHDHRHGETPRDSEVPHDQGDHDHEIVFAVALPAPPAQGLDAPAVGPALGPSAVTGSALLAAWGAPRLLRETGPPADDPRLETVRLLL